MSRELFMLRAAGIVAFAGLVPSCQGPPQLAYTELAVMTYAVGPTRTYKTLQDIVGVLQPGDTVNVDYSATPYPAGVTFTVTGTASNPIRIHGVPDATGRRPVIKSAVNAAGQPNVVHIKYADYYVLENLEIDGSAGQGNGWDGTLGTFRCIFHQGGGITLRNLYVHDCPAHGIASADDGSGSLTLEYSEIARSGGLDTHHPLYIETDPFAYPGAVFRMQYTYVHDGTGGNLLKSRAERNEIYYNWIQQSAYHDVELIGLDSSDAPPRPMNSDVVGNVIEQPAIGIIDTTAVRIGHDWVEASGLPGSHGRYRFVANTFLMPAGTTAAVMKAEGALESLEVHDNVFYSPSTPLTILVDNAGDPAQWTTGRAVSGSNNWIVTGSSPPPEWTTTFNGTAPGFVATNDFHLAPSSPLINHGTTSAPSFSTHPFPNPLYPPVNEPAVHTNPTSATPRPTADVLDIGAYEYSSTGCSYAISPASVAASAAGGSANVTVMAGAGCSWTATGNVTWVTITAGASGTGNGSVTYTVAANTGAARSGTLTIAGQTFTISQAAATTCQSAGTLDWIHGGYPTQTGIFTAEYDATPSVTPIDAVVGLSSGVQTAYTGLAAITSFDVSGYLYARNGSTYQHITTIAYAAGSTYHFRLVVDRGAHTYSAYVQVNGGVEQTLAINYAFRSEQATVGQLDTWNATTETTNATIQVCNVAITPPPRSSLADFYIDQTSVTFPGGNVGDHAAIAPEGLGGSNAVKYTNLQTWDGTPQIHLAAPLDISSVQSTDSLRISLDVSAGRTSSMYIYFNDDWKTYLVSPVLDQTGGYQTFDIPIGSTMRSQMTNSINDIYFKAGDGFPDNGTLWVDEIRFIRP